MPGFERRIDSAAASVPAPPAANGFISLQSLFRIWDQDYCWMTERPILNPGKGRGSNLEENASKQGDAHDRIRNSLGFGGHRKEAIKATEVAIDQLQEALKFDKN